MTAPVPLLAPCPKCGRPQPVTSSGLIERHYDDRLPASARHCRGGRQAAPSEGETP